MPAVNLYAPPVEVSQPTQRRVWPYPDLQSHSLLILTLDRIYLAPLPGPPRLEVLAAAEFGDDPGELLGPDATVIELASIRRAKLDLLSNALTIDSARSRTASQIMLTFAETESADMCFSRIWRRLGEGCSLQKPRDWLALARLPLAILAAIFVATALLSLSIHVVDDLATAQAAASMNVPGEGESILVPRSPVHSLMAWMDWRVVCALGGAAAAATQVWLYRRITQPPLALEITRS
jgi:hypothetical protein